MYIYILYIQNLIIDPNYVLSDQVPKNIIQVDIADTGNAWPLNMDKYCWTNSSTKNRNSIKLHP